MLPPEGAAPDIKNKSFHISADVEIPAEGAEGVLLTQGGRFCGWGLYLLEGIPKFHYNIVGVTRYDVTGTKPLKPGKHNVALDFKYDGGGQGKEGSPGYCRHRCQDLEQEARIRVEDVHVPALL
jgi:arylsulfatase